jgi:RNA polymerase sigma-70 factor (ECF subfamily)
MDDVLERAKRGDATAMEALLAELAPRIRRFGERLCGNPHDADDVLQETLLLVARHLPEFEGRSSLSAWVFALARSACVRRRRGPKNAAPVSVSSAPEPLAAGPSPERQAADRELLGVLLAALSALPDEAREVVLLRDVEGLSSEESAAALGISPQALKSRLHRARTALRERLRPWFEPKAEPARTGCPDIMSLWSRKLEGELSQLDCAQMEQHLRSCGACGAACSALKTALDVCRRAAATEVPGAVQESVKRAVRAWAAERSAG